MTNINRMLMMFFAVGLGVALTACDRDSLSSNNDEVSMSSEAIAFQQHQKTWRDQRRSGLVAADGWTTLVGLHWIEPGAHYLGSDADNGMRLALGPEHLGMLELRDERVRLVPEAGVSLTVDGEPLTGETWLRADDDPEGPSTLGFDEGAGQAVVIKRNGRFALRVRHAQAPTRTGFAGLTYWPADPDWTVPARFVPHPPGQTMEIANIIGAFDEVANPGIVEFEHDGVTYQLEAIDEGGDTLFLVFADRTNGHGSYGAGRFVYVPKPDADGQLEVDFNQAYNPPCAFTAFATCPLPPLENRLDLAVTAGEKSYVARDNSGTSDAPPTSGQ